MSGRRPRGEDPDDPWSGPSAPVPLFTPATEMDTPAAVQRLAKEGFPAPVTRCMSPVGLGCLCSGDLKTAARFWEVRARSSPERAEGWVGVAACLVLSGNPRAAEPYLQRALEVEPGFPAGAVLGTLCRGAPKQALRVLRWLEGRGFRRQAWEGAKMLLKSAPLPAGLYRHVARLMKRVQPEEK